MARTFAVTTLLMLLAGCGLAETGSAGVAGAESAAQQAAQAKQTEDRVTQQIDAAYQQAAEQRRAAEPDAR